MDGWNTSFLLGWLIFRGEPLVSGRVSSRQKGVFIIFFFGGGGKGSTRENISKQHTNLGNQDPFETYAGQIGSFL